MPAKQPIKSPDALTYETFKFEVYPVIKNETILFRRNDIKVFRDEKAHIIIKGATWLISMGTFNAIAKSIAGLSDESAYDKIKSNFSNNTITTIKREDSW